MMEICEELGGFADAVRSANACSGGKGNSAYDCYTVKPGDTVWSIARGLVQRQPNSSIYVEVRRQETRRIAAAITKLCGGWHADDVKLIPGTQISLSALRRMTIGEETLMKMCTRNSVARRDLFSTILSLRKEMRR